MTFRDAFNEWEHGMNENMEWKNKDMGDQEIDWLRNQVFMTTQMDRCRVAIQTIPKKSTQQATKTEREGKCSDNCANSKRIHWKKVRNQQKWVEDTI